MVPKMFMSSLVIVVMAHAAMFHVPAIQMNAPTVNGVCAQSQLLNLGPPPKQRKINRIRQPLFSLAALSPRLARDISRYGANVTMTIFDAYHRIYYAYHPREEMEMASMFKIPILVTLMHRVETQHRCMTRAELDEAMAMIEVSDNTAEVALYNDAGGYWAIHNYLNAIDIRDLRINATSIGYSLLSPISSARLMEKLRTEHILTPAHCRFILALMARVISYQQAGVAATAPPHSHWSMKIGYGPGPDGLWLMDSMGTVTYKGHSYDLAIYSRDASDYASGTARINRLCAEAVEALVGVP